MISNKGQTPPTLLQQMLDADGGRWTLANLYRNELGTYTAHAYGGVRGDSVITRGATPESALEDLANQILALQEEIV